jgi:hypothetical protein
VDPTLINKHNKLYYKAMYLNAELKEVNVIFEQCKKEFLIEASKEKRKPASVSLTKATKRLTEDLDDIFAAKNNNPDLSGFKKLYKKIMLKVHPDKLVLVEDDTMKNMYSDICSKTMNAMDTKSWYLLFGAATDLGIKDIEINDDHIKMLKDDCEKLESKISKVKKTVPWLWFHSNDKIKEKCLKQYLKM